ncbi:sulfotransferase family protein [Aeoliella mucimassa]|uniref:Sulfotransferase domain protein n=1 Tax=Aeoliella mucimassa TaxID=2527972 RepID=A0A518AKM7_9BACT|nr:sulfotransferase [Aeoliella mucimassa]QDU55285.1 Sulfotransferase domain protein [Aeoliella mucimassa]
MSPSTPKPRYSADPTHAWGILTPRFWHGMRLGTWLSLLATRQCRLTPRSMITAASITPVSGFNSIAAAWQNFRFGRQVHRQVLAEPPLFVLGHWRSGTTLLHELLITDPEHTYPNTYECMLPHCHLVTQKWLAPLTSWLLPSKRPMDNVEAGWDKPQEDEFALCNLGLPSPYLCWAFPHNGPVHSEYLDLREVPKRDRRRWQALLKLFVKSIAVSRNRRIILKSPPHTARVKWLLEIFPRAKFVHISRDPFKLFPSTIRLWKSLSDVQGLQPDLPEYDWMEGEVLQNLQVMYKAYQEDRELIPEGNLCEIRYEDLTANPHQEIQRMYEQLDLGNYDRVKPGVDRYIERTGDYQTNRYQIPPEIEAKVRDNWGIYFDMFGYGESGSDS